MCQMKWWFLNGARMPTTKKNIMSAHRYTMAQMKNKTNETKNVHTELCKYNHISQWVYVGK